jgi:cation diffusion facilitator CzcD-associated flavoprotein CzcO
MDTQQAVVVGGGPAGLASAAELQRAGFSVTVLEQADAVGSSWRNRYDRLRLNSSRPFSKLPGARYPKGTPMFPTRDQLVKYLEDYATQKRLDVRLGTRLERLDRDGASWRLHTSRGELRADQVVVAAGYQRNPFVPAWPGKDRFQGRLLHSDAYRNAAPFRGADVLVVGAGSSAMEIAYDVLTGGAARVRMSVRTPPNILIRFPPGPLFARLLMKLGPKRGDRVISYIRRHEIGDLTEFGLPEPEEGVFSRLMRLGVAPAIVDMDVIEAIKDRRIEVVAGVESLDTTGVQLADGSRIEPEAMIAATGYRPGLEPVLGHLGVLDERGMPRATGEAEAAPGLRFVGYVPRPAHIGYIAGEARRMAQAIAGPLPAAR